MRIENSGIEEIVMDLRPLDYVMGRHGFIRAGQWDYERVTYDYKIGSAEKNITYYVRIQGYAIEGDVDRKDAVIQLMTPLLGKHYYPHGIEYDEAFPDTLKERAETLVKRVKEEIDQYVAQ